MTIKFHCEHCRREVQAPDEAGGKRGKCPHCGTSNYIPAPVSEEDVLPLAPLDDEEERQRQKEVQELLRQERELLAETRGGPPTPLEHREDLAGQDLHHFVVNYCLDLHSGNLTRAQTHVTSLRKFGPAGLEAVSDFMTGKAIEPALANVPGGLLQGFLRQLKQSLQEA
jgi:hypothetical protein